MTDEAIGPFKVKFNGKLMELVGFTKGSRIFDVKDKLFEMTNVPPQNQKLLGLLAERGLLSHMLLLISLRENNE